MSLGDKGDELFRLAIDASPAAMIVTGADGVIQFTNAETQHIFGYTARELVGKSIDILVPKALRQDHASLRRDFFARPTKRGMGVGRDLKAVRRDGNEFPVEIGLTPIETEAGVIVLATVLDITARREAEAALAQRAFELERANERLAEFAYVASHDLQEPLRKIAAFSDLLERAIMNRDQADMVRAKDVVRTSALRARELVDDLLTYSRTINDAQLLQDLDLRDEIGIALEDLSEMINETGTQIDIDAPHVRFRADRSLFARLIHNIVSNAIKFRKPNQTAQVRIIVNRIDEDVVRLAIIDNGIGFESKYATMIFEPFKRLHSRAKYPGTGIGLAICKSVVDRHGWRLSIESEPGEGARFFITIPASL